MNITRRSLTDVSLLVLVNAMWSAQYSAYKVVSGRMGPVTVSAWVFLFASVVLLPFLVLERRRNGIHVTSERSLLKRANAIGFLMIGVLGLIPASAFLAWGESRSSASNAALIYLTVPVITALLASIILKERMRPTRWASLLLSLIGVLILSDFHWRHVELASTEYLFGNMLVLLACTSSSFYNVYCKELLRRFRPLEVLIYGYVLAFVISVPLASRVEHFSLRAISGFQASTWLALIVLSVLSWGLAMVLWMLLLKRLDVSQASVSIYLLPFLGVLISTLTLKERFTTAMMVGGLVTLMGTILITTTEPTSV